MVDVVRIKQYKFLDFFRAGFGNRRPDRIQCNLLVNFLDLFVFQSGSVMMTYVGMYLFNIYLSVESRYIFCGFGSSVVFKRRKNHFIVM